MPMAILWLRTRRPCCPEDVPMSRGRPHRRFRRPWKMLGPESTRGRCHVPREWCVQPRALANTLLREPLIIHPELTSAFPSLSSARKDFHSFSPLPRRISYSFDVYGSQLPRCDSDVPCGIDDAHQHEARFASDE